MGEELTDKQTFYLDLILMILIIVCFSYALYTYLHDKQEVYSTTQSHIDFKLNMTTWLVSYNFTSTVFSAQNEIDALC